MTDTQVLLGDQGALEDFSAFIKDTVCDAFSGSEKFSTIRLRHTQITYSDFMQHGTRGIANDLTGITVSQTESAVQLAGTIVHEMGHILVGTSQEHNENWRDACGALGMLRVETRGQQYALEDFTPHLQKAIAEGIAKFTRQHPEMIYDPNIEIPLPSYIGPPTCPEAKIEGCSFGHQKHVMQFQFDGVRWLLNNRKPGLLNADEPGLGKTPETMMYINATHPKKVIIVCPNNMKYVWRDHFMEWCVWDDLKEQLEIAHTGLFMYGDVVIINYEALRKWGSWIAKQHWDLVVFDEFHYAKNPSSARSKACFAITNYDKAMGLTGTPFKNYWDEIFPLCHYLDRPNWRSFSEAQIKYGTSDSRLGRNLNRMNQLLRNTIMLRRFKKDVLSELPAKRRMVVQFEVSPEIRKLIEQEKKLFDSLKGVDNVEAVRLINAIKNESDVVGDDIDWASLIEELKFTKRYAFEEMAKLAHEIARCKVPMVIEHVENVLDNREKCIVFGHHRDVLTSIAEHFAPHSVLLLGGSGDQAGATNAASTKFSNDPDCTVFVGGITLAQGYSLKSASTVVFAEEDWVPGIMTQAEDRSHGINRGDADAGSLLIQHLVFEDSLDTYKAKLNIRKQKAIDRATGRL